MLTVHVTLDTGETVALAEQAPPASTERERWALIAVFRRIATWGVLRTVDGTVIYHPPQRIQRIEARRGPAGAVVDDAAWTA